MVSVNALSKTLLLKLYIDKYSLEVCSLQNKLKLKAVISKIGKNSCLLFLGDGVGEQIAQ